VVVSHHWLVVPSRAGARINSQASNGLGLNYLPAPIYDEFVDEARFGPLQRTEDGRLWPRPIQVRKTPSWPRSWANFSLF
jgi:hypothetical protein